ncbi:ABC transporter permease [Streptomyces sp. NPDC005438]|uniref:DUF7224 domain-containing protein n=1 Tax=Streptomyces sp. NPDC005438 TaxID=3156880 RepID=UPI0033BF540C
MLTTYRIELRRSPLLTAFPVLVALDLVVLFGRSRYWIGVWPEASAAAQVVTLFLGPALAGVSAWQAGRSSRAGMSESLLASARPTWRVEATRLCATLTLGFLAYLVGCATAAAVSYGEAGPGFLWPSYLLLGASSLIVFAAVGHLAGRCWPSAGFTPVTCALGCFVAMLTLPFDFVVLSGPPDRHLQPGPVLVRLLFALALATLAVTAPTRTPGGQRQTPRRRTPARLRAVAVGSALASVAAFLATATAGELRAERPSSAVTPRCERAREDAPRVCVWPEHRKYLPELARMAHRLDHVEPSWMKSPGTFGEFGLHRTRRGDPGFDIAEGHVRTAAIAMADSVLTRSIGLCTPPRARTRAWQALDNIQLWLEYRSTGKDPDEADEGLHTEGVSRAEREAAKAVRSSPSEQREWLATERAHVHPSWCEPDERF